MLQKVALKASLFDTITASFIWPMNINLTKEHRMRRNILRELLDAGKPSLGTRQINISPMVTEVIGRTGMFDYIELSGEYTDWSLESLANFARAVELFPDMTSMMKVEQDPRVFVTDRALDAGIQNVLFTDCRSAEEVKECIRAVRAETPEDGGIHGAGSRRSVGYIFEGGSPAWVKAQKEVVCAFMIEKRSAVEQIDEILDVQGVDMIQFGPTDYSVSIGKPGMQRSPEVQNVQRDLIEKALKKGVHPRVELVALDRAQDFIDMGVRHFNIGIDLRMILEWCQKNGEQMRKLLGV
jgi:2-keto-3-deoxy-L-rhamnonate aldolase RhmA